MILETIPSDTKGQVNKASQVFIDLLCSSREGLLIIYVQSGEFIDLLYSLKSLWLTIKRNWNFCENLTNDKKSNTFFLNMWLSVFSLMSSKKKAFYQFVPGFISDFRF